MKIQIVGGGGRVASIAWSLAKSRRVKQIVCAPGNAGISMEKLQSGDRVVCVPIAATDIAGQLALAQALKPDLIIVQEDDPLYLGIVDLLQANDFRVWGPNHKAAMFEWSKIFAYEFMRRHDIPAPRSAACLSQEEVLVFAEAQNWMCAIKVDGLAQGKGVTLCRNKDAVLAATRRIFTQKEFGSAGERVLAQELLSGKEISLHYLCGGKHALTFESSKDHKSANDGDTGDNTGGMGTISPSPDIDPEYFDEIAEEIILPFLDGCKEEGIDFRGILYPGVMLTDDGPKVLEINARFGDSETQTYLTRLKTDLLDLIDGSLAGFLPSELQWSSDVSVCVNMASVGYPGSYEKRKLITGLEEVALMDNVKIFHAGTALRDGAFVTNGGRVLGVTAWAPNLAAARQQAYRAVNLIKFEGGEHYRRDIGGPPL